MPRRPTPSDIERALTRWALPLTDSLLMIGLLGSDPEATRVAQRLIKRLVTQTAHLILSESRRRHDPALLGAWLREFRFQASLQASRRRRSPP